MTKRYDLTLKLTTTDGVKLLSIEAANKTMETMQQLVRLSMSDFEKTEKPVISKVGRSRQIMPPIEPLEPTSDEVKDV